MYNTQFKVKYNEIEQELCVKLKEKTPQEYEENSDEEYEYSTQDVIDISHKLYIDEFISVFGANDILDDKIDVGMKYIFEKMCTNVEFNKIIEEMSQLALNAYLPDKEFQDQQLLDFKQLITLILFSKNIFYITHKCICQHLELGTIDDELLVDLRAHSVNHLKKQCP